MMRFRLPARWALRGLLLLPLLLVVGLVQAQVRVTGTVTDAVSRRPIPGATVLLQRTRTGIMATNEGDFSITAKNTDTLVFRAVGHKPQRLLLAGTGLSQLIVQIRLQQDTVQLGEVRITEGRPDRATINRALRNIKRPSTAPTSAVKRPPAPKPLFPVDSAAPKAPVPTLASPVSLLYEQFSREGKQRRKMEEINQQEAAAKAAELDRQNRRRYNKNFKDNTGYEVK
ncbi:carboxypeptidase-like regulatory domain-containing protein [Hymenobacter sp. 102]|uniref:carboxypeptidase-like regulatory domain-containing protein n=1 Tax=Hymenobacter sp. 102 TaxID=3403152 RepID=UPI003CEB1FB2